MQGTDTRIMQAEVIGVPVHVGDMRQAIGQIQSWAKTRESRAVFFCNVHSLTTARLNTDFEATVNSADLRLPDGAPIAYMLRRSGFQDQKRVSGPDLMQNYLAVAEQAGESIFLYGSTPEVLVKLVARVSQEHPRLKIHTYSPPFRQLTSAEDEEIVRMIASSGASTVWVALGCPKQEQWIEEHRGRIPAVMLGVGAAFAFIAGVAPRAPLWMQKAGLEWLHRLFSDPGRLWKRYLATNSAFLAYAAIAALKDRQKRSAPASQPPTSRP